MFDYVDDWTDWTCKECGHYPLSEGDDACTECGSTWEEQNVTDH